MMTRSSSRKSSSTSSNGTPVLSPSDKKGNAAPGKKKPQRISDKHDGISTASDGPESSIPINSAESPISNIDPGQRTGHGDHELASDDPGLGDRNNRPSPSVTKDPKCSSAGNGEGSIPGPSGDRQRGHKNQLEEDILKYLRHHWSGKQWYPEEYAPRLHSGRKEPEYHTLLPAKSITTMWVKMGLRLKDLWIEDKDTEKCGIFIQAIRSTEALKEAKKAEKAEKAGKPKKATSAEKVNMGETTGRITITVMTRAKEMVEERFAAWNKAKSAGAGGVSTPTSRALEHEECHNLKQAAGFDRKHPASPIIPSSAPKRPRTDDSSIALLVESDEFSSSLPSPLFSRLGSQASGDENNAISIASLSSDDDSLSGIGSNNPASAVNDPLQVTIEHLRSGQMLQSNHLDTCLQYSLVENPQWHRFDPGYPIDESFPPSRRPYPRHLLFIMNDNCHWTLGHLDQTDETFEVFNSCKTMPVSLVMINKWAGRMMQNVKYIEKECPQQTDAVSCGLFVLAIAMALYEERPIPKHIDPDVLRKETIDRLCKERATKAALLSKLATSPEQSIISLEPEKAASMTTLTKEVAMDQPVDPQLEALTVSSNHFPSLALPASSVGVSRVDDTLPETGDLSISETVAATSLPYGGVNKMADAALQNLSSFVSNYDLVKKTHHISKEKLATMSDRARKRIVQLAIELAALDACCEAESVVIAKLTTVQEQLNYDERVQEHMQTCPKPSSVNRDGNLMRECIDSMIAGHLSNHRELRKTLTARRKEHQANGKGHKASIEVLRKDLLVILQDRLCQEGVSSAASDGLRRISIAWNKAADGEMGRDAMMVMEELWMSLKF